MAADTIGTVVPLARARKAREKRGHWMKWEGVKGGRIWIALDGARSYYLQTRIRGRKYDVRFVGSDLLAVTEQLRRFYADPAGFDPRGIRPEYTFPLNDQLAADYLKWCVSVPPGKKRPRASEHWVRKKKSIVEWWIGVLRDRDLGRVKLFELKEKLRSAPNYKLLALTRKRANLNQPVMVACRWSAWPARMRAVTSSKGVHAVATPAICRSSLVLVMLLAAQPSWAAGKSKFIEGALAAVPVPTAGEFPTPEKVVTAYIEAFNANDLDAAMKCFIIRELYGKATWDVEARQMGGISGRRAFPGVDLLHYKKVMEGFDFVWLMLNRSRVAQKDEKGLMDASLPLSADPIESKRQLEDFEAPFREGLRTPIELVSLKRSGSTPQTLITRSLGATEYLVVFADTKLAGTPMELDFLVAKLGTNYRILTVVGPNGPPGLPFKGSLTK